MRAVVQRVNEARVEVGGLTVGAIGRGLLVFLGIGRDDVQADVIYLVEKVLGLRVFEDDRGKMSRALREVGGGLLLISQFTLYGDTTRGRRPSFDQAMPPSAAEVLYDSFLSEARARHAPVESGRFGADMLVTVANDGPVTLILKSAGERG
jgi:D-tyrosyl-tRNA(Tyr) deacylase